MEKLTLADIKILNLLEYNPRVTFKDLANACHVSKDTIKYRINRLETDKIILGYTSFIDYKKLGHQSYKLYLKINGSVEQKEALKAYLRKQKNVFAIFESVGEWNIAIALFAKTHLQYNEVENQILENFGSIITNRRFCSMIDAHMLQKDFLNERSQNKFLGDYFVWGEVENNLLDDTDKKLIKLMHENARSSLVDMAVALKMSIDAVKNRIQRLDQKGIVKVYQTVINYNALGFDQYKLFIYPGVYSQEAESRIVNYLKETQSCINVVRTIGPWKIEAEFFAKKSQEVEDIIDQLNERFKGNIADFELNVLRNIEMFACKELLLE